MKNFYITTPIYYVNDFPHIGHAYTSIAADVIARFKRLDGFKVHFLTGTDEHGQKIQKSAEKANIETQKFVDSFAANFQKLSQQLNLSNDDFIRTTEERHIRFVKKVWQTLYDKGYIYLAKYSGWYAVRDEAFYQEAELIKGKAPTGAEVEWVEEESYFFKLSAFEEKLLNFYNDNPNFVAPESRKNEVISFVKLGLKDLSISRTTFRWGIPVPGDEKHVMYVWLDALFNYLSAIDSAQTFLPCDLHLIGKDILRFHAVYWPAFLMAAGFELPKRVFAHGWWTNEGVKISKSLGNVIDPLKLVEKFGLDYVRYFLMRAIPFGNDGNYSESQFVQLTNAELANNIGNLAQRVIAFVNKNCDSKIPAFDAFSREDQQLLILSEQVHANMQKFIDNQEISEAIEAIVGLSKAANSYIDLNAPWQLKKTDLTRMNTVLYVLLEVIRKIAILLQPFVPDSAGALLDLLNIEKRNFSDLSTRLQPKAPIKEAKPIFLRHT
ncbi:MAG: methionine--tRNA ligase [Candidatus Midichloria mitochondrii]|uniref:Methionine--tRNA ligase n=2 Tax=Candidatus Midichloria mitochondrii TaxID=234827 RepID=F7XVA5_MIDMI|nr:methionine--tRNA ligase [Candidatus Midichloria mitochondrii]AEI88604.1 methionyl-tRNA synthetase [Candidatus Midichloria mitochondrii IricVA]CBJ36187.1 methionyl-tRNA synthetase [Candidatus Midichloria mitochondrii]